MPASFSGDKRSTRRKDPGPTWDDIKPDAVRMIKEEGEILRDVMSKIERDHGFEKCERTWRTKLREWHCGKNVPAAAMEYIAAKKKKRALEEGKDTALYYQDKHITAETIGNWERRKTRKLSNIAETPPGVSYHTPPHQNNESQSPEGMYDDGSPLSQIPTLPSFYEEFVGDDLSLSQISTFPMAHTSSVSSHGSNMESPLVPTEGAAISMLDRYVSDESEPWSVYSLRHQVYAHENAMAKLRQIVAQVTDQLALPDSVDLPVSGRWDSTFCCIEHSFFAEPGPPIDEHAENPEGLSIEQLLDLSHLTSTLARFQDAYGEFNEQTVNGEAELAHELQRYNMLEEAEYHWRRVLKSHQSLVPQVCLGVILAKTSRFEESTSLFTSAISNAIVGFRCYSPEDNSKAFKWLGYFLDRYVSEGKYEWVALIPCISQMMATVENATSEDTINQTFPRLLIHGLRFAHGLSVLEAIDSAEYMYRVLLEHSSPLDGIALERAKAHQRYGVLLRGEQKWASSAKQLLLACDSAVDSRTYDRSLVALFKSDYNDLLPYLAHMPEDSSIRNRLVEAMVAYDLHQNSTPWESSANEPSSLDAIFLSLPQRFANLQTSGALTVGQFGFSSMATNPASGDGNRTSTTSISWSSIESHENGKTYSSDDFTRRTSHQQVSRNSGLRDCVEE